MFVQKQRYGNVSSGENSEEDVSEGDILQVKLVSFKSTNLVFLLCFYSKKILSIPIKHSRD